MSVHVAPSEDEDNRFLVREARSSFAHLPREPIGGRDGVRVYVMGDERGFVKVGISNNPRRRAHALSAGNPAGLTVVFESDAFSRGYAMAVEAAVHDFLAGAGLGREWFHSPPEVAVLAVKWMADGL